MGERIIVERYEYAGRNWYIREEDTQDKSVIHENWGDDPYRIANGISGTVIDIGGNIGTFALRALAAGAHDVHSYEADPSNAEMFRLNCEHEIAIDLHQVAVWSESDKVLSFISAKGASAVEPNTDREHIEVPTISLNDILCSYPSVDFLKMDIEGGEVEAISTCDFEVMRRVKRIAMEYHGIRNPWGTMIRRLAGTFDLEIVGHDEQGTWSGGMLHGRNKIA